MALKRWTKVTAPQLVLSMVEERASAGAPRLQALSQSSTASRYIRNTGPMSAGILVEEARVMD